MLSSLFSSFRPVARITKLIVQYPCLTQYYCNSGQWPELRDKFSNYCVLTKFCNSGQWLGLIKQVFVILTNDWDYKVNCLLLCTTVCDDLFVTPVNGQNYEINCSITVHGLNKQFFCNSGQWPEVQDKLSYYVWYYFMWQSCRKSCQWPELQDKLFFNSFMWTEQTILS